MPDILQLLCVLCTSVAYAPVPQMSRAAGDVWYTHEVLAHGQHLLRLSTTDLLLDWDRARGARLQAFATNFANATCGGRFRFVDIRRTTTYAGQVVFVCR